MTGIMEPPYSLPYIRDRHNWVGPGGEMRSTNFVSGSAGWQLDGEGNFEASSGTFRGSITGATGTFTGTLSVGGTTLTTGNTLNTNTTKSDVGLSNVDNDSTSTIQAGTTKANVGLSSVDNDSTATIQAGTTAANVGLGNVQNYTAVNQAVNGMPTASVILTSGLIRAGQTGYDAGTGFFLGFDSGTAKFSIGNASGNKLTWDGSALSITGAITSTSGTIGGWTIGASSLSLSGTDASHGTMTLKNSASAAGLWVSTTDSTTDGYIIINQGTDATYGNHSNLQLLAPAMTGSNRPGMTIKHYADGDSLINIGTDDSNPQIILTDRAGGVNAMTLTSSTVDIIGDLFVGDTARTYAGHTQYGGLCFPRGEILFSNTNAQNQMYFCSNLTMGADGGFDAINTGMSGFMAVDDGAISLSTAPSVSAGAAPSFVTALHITNAGNVGIGTTSPAAPLQVNTTASDAATIQMNTTHASSKRTRLQFAYGGTQGWEWGTDISANGGTELYAYNRATAVIAMVIKDDGKVGIGTSSPNNLLSMAVPLSGLEGLAIQYGTETKAGLLLNPATGEVRVGALNSTGDYFTTFYADNAEAMRITATGNVGIGTAAPTTYASTSLHIAGSGTDAAIKFTNTSTGAANTDGFDLESNGLDFNFVLREVGALKFWTSTAHRMTIASNGYVGFGVAAPTIMIHLNGGTPGPSNTGIAAAWVPHSSIRWKTNVEELTTGTTLIKAIRPVTYQHKDPDTDEADDVTLIGFIAEEVREHVPSIAYNDPDDTDWCVGLDYDRMTAVLMSGMKELITRVEALEDA